MTSPLHNTTRPPGRVVTFTASIHHSTTWSSTTIIIHSTNHSTNRSSITIIIHSTNHSTNKCSITIIIHSTNHSTTKSSSTIIHHSTSYSTASLRVFSIPHSTRQSSIRKKRRLQQITRPITGPPRSSIVLNPSQYCVVLSIRVSEHFAISSLYFIFSRKKFSSADTVCY
uniref:Uncharacterized protein At2g10110 n=1 Tax=Arabidopsis thaliana TaxID=3702 RepID=Q9SK14_ARATH|nr:hypothetical protein [Arabidopsis thaliana]